MGEACFVVKDPASIHQRCSTTDRLIFCLGKTASSALAFEDKEWVKEIRSHADKGPRILIDICVYDV